MSRRTLLTKKKSTSWRIVPAVLLMYNQCRRTVASRSCQTFGLMTPSRTTPKLHGERGLAASGRRGKNEATLVQRVPPPLPPARARGFFLLLISGFRLWFITFICLLGVKTAGVMMVVPNCWDLDSLFQLEVCISVVCRGSLRIVAHSSWIHSQRKPMLLSAVSASGVMRPRSGVSAGASHLAHRARRASLGLPPLSVSP